MCTPAGAAPKTPCDVFDLPADVQALKARIKTRTRSAFAPIARDAAQLAQSGAPAARACAHYIAGAAWFFLSAKRTDQVRHAAQAVHHLVAAQALAPSLMKGRQPQARLRTVWQRLGNAWLPKGSPVGVTLPAGQGVVQLSAPPGIDVPVRIALPLASKPQTVQLRPGRWQVGLKTACGESTAQLPLSSGPVPLPAAPPCAVQLKPRDAAGPVTDFQVTDRTGAPVQQVDARFNPMTVQARGYLPTAVRVPDAGGVLPVTLKRCPVQVVPHIRPPDAKVEGAGPRPWGTITLSARRAGYVDLQQKVQVPRPKTCKGAQHAVDLSMRRPVAVIAVNADGEPVVLSRLWINEAVVSATGLALPMGLYRYQAEHPALGTVSGAFTVRTCGSAACDAPQLRIQFERARSSGGSNTGAWIVMGTGGLALAAGAVSGVSALSTQGEIDDYTTRQQEGFPIDDLVMQRDEQAQTADRAFLIGGALLVGGLVWYLIGD
jgi:hypothetical protein